MTGGPSTPGHGHGERGREARVWIDGELRPAGSATVSVFDHGLTVGDGVFETMKVVRSPDGDPRAFALDRHLRRLRRSLAAMGLELARTDRELGDAVAATLRANDGGPEGPVGRVRLTVTGGDSPLGSDRGDAAATVVIATGPQAQWGPASDVCTVPWVRNERAATAGVKSTSYADNVVALRFAHDHGADEAIFANTVGALCEGTGSNVFLVHGGRLVTPPLSSGCLAGITRELVLEAFGGEIEERDVPLAALAQATEAFLTSSTRDVHPIASVDGVALASCPGPFTIEAQRRFASIVD